MQKTKNSLMISAFMVSSDQKILYIVANNMSLNQTEAKINHSV